MNHYAVPKTRHLYGPLSTTVELAEEFGISCNKLSFMLRTVPGAPPCVRTTANGNVRAQWYERHVAHRWWHSTKTVT